MDIWDADSIHTGIAIGRTAVGEEVLAEAVYFEIEPCDVFM